MGVYNTNPTNHATEFQINQRWDKVFVVIVLPFVTVETRLNVNNERRAAGLWMLALYSSTFRRNRLGPQESYAKRANRIPPTPTYQVPPRVG
jgi:hypothetical protein